jgi:NAD-dependent deacetylase
MQNSHFIQQAAELIKNSKHLIAFTGAGISVESGIPPFRGENGIWNKHDPNILELSYFKRNPKESWEQIMKMFFEITQTIEPNYAHYALFELQKSGYLKALITQNIDNLHYLAGNTDVIEFHGNMRDLICTKCGFVKPLKEVDLSVLPPKCEKCNGVFKPDFIIFGESIPSEAYNKSFENADKSDVVVLIGTSGEVMPASFIPHRAKESGAKIIEINLEPSAYTNSITDIFLQGKATEIMKSLIEELNKL